ncbi:hypothetical protein NDU88_002499 [Pleurodeles waltl]|uniref:Uncharacterized protein n=1 Tax=Pleurodeles waltl TaxID=8319 RepID=A0AAV7MMU8_PLEWA|nr:hypothetical protein NDU88_002499 [Pleurodeles waltl]
MYGTRAFPFSVSASKQDGCQGNKKAQAREEQRCATTRGAQSALAGRESVTNKLRTGLLEQFTGRPNSKSHKTSQFLLAEALRGIGLFVFRNREAAD